MKTILLKGGYVVTGQDVVCSDVVLRDGRIELAGDKEGCDEVVDITGKYVVPGFVDIHFHGYNLFEFTAGLYDPKTDSYDSSKDAYEQGIATLRATLAGFGVTSFYVSTFASPIETLKCCYGRLADYLSGEEDTTVGARLLGGNVEGMFINPQMAGAQNPELLFEPSAEIFERLADRGAIKMVNVVPDYGEKSCKFTEYLTAKGIIVGAGHTAATCDQVFDAAKAGLKFAVHFTNGPTGGSYKPFNGGGTIEAVLKLDELYAELICDGFHINPEYVRDIIKRKGVDKILGVTDCTFIAGSDLKEFTCSGIRGQISDDGAYLRVSDKPDTLFGSTLTMNRGFNNVLNWLTTNMDGIWNRMHEAMEFEDALVVVAKIYSTNPCVLTGLAKEGYGTITDGAKADLCVLDITGSAGNYKVTVESTIVDGNLVFDRKPA